MSYFRHARRTQMIWAGGHIAAPTAEKAYRVEDLSTFHPEIIESSIADVYIGQAFPGEPALEGRYIDFGFAAEVRGKHTTDEPPPEGSWLRAACFNEASSGSTPNKVYRYQLGNEHFYTGTPTGDLDPVTTVKFNIDRRAYTAQNAVVGELEIEFIPGKVPMYRFKARAQVASVVSLTGSGYTEAAPTVAFDAGNRGVMATSEALTLNAYSPRILSCKLKIKFDIDEMPDLNSAAAGYGIPGCSGYDPRLEIRMYEDLKTAFDPFSLQIAKTPIAAALLHNSGGATGQKLGLAFNGLIADAIKVENVKGRLVQTFELMQQTGATLPALAWT